MRIGPYEVLGELGAGGMGVVYRARDPELRREVALKVLPGGAPPDVRARFLREGRTGARLRHEGIVAVHAAGEADGQAYIVQELIEGESLSRVLERGTLPPERAAAIVERVARSLSYAHGEGVIHRDVKPGNILLDRAGAPHLADFGLARTVEVSAALSQSGQAIGTPHYMSPEQAEGRPGMTDARSDVWACGVVLYECLAAARPFEGGPHSVMEQVVRDEPAPLRRKVATVPRALETIVSRCLEKEPHRRYPTAEALAEDLARFLRGEEVEARPVSLVERLRRRVRRNPAPWALGAALAATLLLVAGGLGLSDWRERARVAEELRLARELAPADPDRAIGVLDLLAKRAPGAPGLEEIRAAADRRRDEIEVERLRTQAGALLRAGEKAAREHAGAAGDARRRDAAYAAARAGFGGSCELLASHPDAPERRSASGAMAALAAERLREAEAAGDEEAAARFEADLRAFGAESHARELEGSGTLSLDTVPTGAEAELLRFEPQDGALVPKPLRSLGPTPIREAPLPMGSYLLLLRKPGFLDARLTIRVERCEAEAAPDPVPLLTEGQVGPGYVYVPPGETVLGGDAEATLAWPRRKVRLPGFLIAEREVSMREYGEFLASLRASGFPEAEVRRRAPRRIAGDPFGRLPEDWPALGVSWEDAEAYAAWRTGVEGRAVRLPRQEEWERAARGADGRPYPWGPAFRWDRVVGARSPDQPDGRPSPRPVGSARDDVSPFGVRDLSGSVVEWCADEVARGLRAVRGGAWNYADAAAFRVAGQGGYQTDNVSDAVGFRVAAEPRPR
ncbi:MAG: SUMF1/EgtB/PvdO family nonheme iron enzyme [Planctomycetales bacterium]|nr:SUMF1/EgtB/PvdO family nonheme iron enzyme [Planctomycetales bacterium]